MKTINFVAQPRKTRFGYEYSCPGPGDQSGEYVRAELAREMLAALEAFVEAWEKCLQLEKTDVALRIAQEVIAKAKGGD